MPRGGKRQGAGRKAKSNELTLKELLDAGWSDTRKGKAIRAQVELAEKGDTKAFLALMAYRYGRPTERHEVTGADGTSLIPAKPDIASEDFDFLAGFTEGPGGDRERSQSDHGPGSRAALGEDGSWGSDGGDDGLAT
jgi:hypothetical protein